MLDLIESEVGGSIQYRLSLSAQPNASAIVKIKLIIKSEECYAHNESSKFKLQYSIYKFGPDNYNIPQIVVSRYLHNTTFFDNHFCSVSFFHKHFYVLTF